MLNERRLASHVSAFAADTDRYEGLVLGFETGHIEILDGELNSVHRLYHSTEPVHALYVLDNLRFAGVAGNCLKEWFRNGYEACSLEYAWVSESLRPARLSSITVT